MYMYMYLSIQEIVKKAHQKIAMFRRCFIGLVHVAKITTMYSSLIHPACIFCIHSLYIPQNQFEYLAL